jgi:hypothetical protein
MNVAIRPVVQVQAGNSPAAFTKNVVVAAHVQTFHDREQRFLATFRGNERKCDVSAARESLGLLVDEMPNLESQVTDEARQAHRTAGNAEYCLGLRASSHHVHVNIGLDARRIVVFGQINDAALDLRRPEEADGT